MLFYNKTVEKRVRTASDEQCLGKLHFFFAFEALIHLTVTGKPVLRYIYLQFFKKVSSVKLSFSKQPK